MHYYNICKNEKLKTARVRRNIILYIDVLLETAYIWPADRVISIEMEKKFRNYITTRPYIHTGHGPPYLYPSSRNITKYCIYICTVFYWYIVPVRCVYNMLPDSHKSNRISPRRHRCKRVRIYIYYINSLS